MGITRNAQANAGVQLKAIQYLVDQNTDDLLDNGVLVPMNLLYCYPAGTVEKADGAQKLIVG